MVGNNLGITQRSSDKEIKVRIKRSPNNYSSADDSHQLNPPAPVASPP